MAIPYQVLEVKEQGRGVIEVAGRRREIDLGPVPEAKAGEYVLVYLGSAMARLDEDEAREVMNLYQAMMDGAAP